MSEDTRKYKRIVRVSDEADARIRAYAAEHGRTPSEAAIALVMRPDIEPSAAGALALPSDLEERLIKLAARRKKTLDELKIYALEVAAGRLEAVDRFADNKRSGAL